MNKRPKATQKFPQRIKLHLYLTPEVVTKLDRRAKAESRTTRTDMARALIERGLRLEA